MYKSETCCDNGIYSVVNFWTCSKKKLIISLLESSVSYQKKNLIIVLVLIKKVLKNQKLSFCVLQLKTYWYN